MTARILVVDDDQDVRDLVCRILEEEGYLASAAAGGKQALEHMAAAAPDLLITDLVMPGVDGFEVLERLRSLAPLAPALLITGGGLPGPEEDPRALLAAGPVLRKPFTRAEVLLAVRRALPPGNT